MSDSPAKGRILVMDDEEPIRRIFTLMLERFGFEAETVAHGQAALRAYRVAREAGKPFDAVILDLTIASGLGGIETLAQLRALDPQVRAIVATGSARDAADTFVQQHGFQAVISKPFRFQEIADTLAQVLGLPEPPGV
jgi:CheY-like chemotaxis protein